MLLGDAAHAMTPDLGQGGNQALEDAATLVRLIGDAAGAPPGRWIDPALTEYDRLRRPRTQLLAQQARLVGRVGQTRGAVAVRLRDIAMRLLPDAMLGRQLLDVQAWQPPKALASSGGAVGGLALPRSAGWAGVRRPRNREPSST